MESCKVYVDVNATFTKDVFDKIEKYLNFKNNSNLKLCKVQRIRDKYCDEVYYIETKLLYSLTEKTTREWMFFCCFCHGDGNTREKHDQY